MAGPSSRIPPYKDFLQPALQRRFASTAFVLLLVAYLQALSLASWHSVFWSLFPIGPTGVRAFMLFVCGLTVLILRIGQYHVGVPTSHSPLRRALLQVFSLGLFETLSWYFVSSSVFALVFLVSAPDDGGLQLVNHNAGRRAYLNEGPIFFVCTIATAAGLAAVAHRVLDLDRLDLGELLPKDGAGRPLKPNAATRLGAVARQFPQMAISAVARAVLLVIGMCLAYPLLLRRSARSWFLLFLRPFFNLPKTNVVPVGFPLSVGVLSRTSWGCCHLLFLWSTANLAFNAFMVKEPLKNGKPLTADSRDPNGSLLNGLKSKKLAHQAFAMWELRHIVDSAPERRRAIFEDIDRQGGAMWTQIFAICMDLFGDMETRVDEALRPPNRTTADEERWEKPKTQALVRVKDEPVVPQPRAFEGFEHEIRKRVRDFALSPGKTPADALAPHVMRGAHSLEQRVFGDYGGVSSLQDRLSGLVSTFIRLPGIQTLYQQRFTRRYTGLVLGGPYAEKTLYINAAHVLGKLAVISLQEDKYGNVHRDVQAIIRTLTNVVGKVAILKEEFPPHWTEVVAAEAGGRVVKNTGEIDAVISAARAALGQVVEAFQPYRNDLRLSPLDLRLALEASKEPVPAQPSLPPPPPPAQPSPPPLAPAPEMQRARRSGEGYGTGGERAPLRAAPSERELRRELKKKGARARGRDGGNVM